MLVVVEPQARLALIVGDVVLDQEHRDILRRIAEQMKADLAMAIRGAAQHRAHEPRTKQFEQPHRFERASAQRIEAPRLLVGAKKPLVRLARALDLVVAGKTAQIPRAEPLGGLALGEVIVPDSVLDHQPRRFVRDLLPYLDMPGVHDRDRSPPPPDGARWSEQPLGRLSGAPLARFASPRAFHDSRRDPLFSKGLKFGAGMRRARELSGLGIDAHRHDPRGRFGNVLLRALESFFHVRDPHRQGGPCAMLWRLFAERPEPVEPDPGSGDDVGVEA